MTEDQSASEGKRHRLVKVWREFLEIGKAWGMPVVVIWIGLGVTGALGEAELRSKNFELAVDILRDDPKASPETPSLRQWAIAVVDDFGVPLSEEAKEELRTSPLVVQDRLPFKDRLLIHIRDLTEELERLGVDGSALGCASMLDSQGRSPYSNYIEPKNEEEVRILNMLIDYEAACRHFYDMN